MELVRLNKALSEAGITSRRKADRLIEQGLVLVNGKKVFEMGIKINPSKDRIVVEGQPVVFSNQKVYVMFHKPKNVMTTLNDPEGRPTVIDYFKKYAQRIFPIGRLDWESEGLLLLTNDGDYANSVMHPKGEVTKSYLVKVSGHPERKDIDKLLTGVSIATGKAKVRHIERIKRPDSSDKYDWFKVVISEGKNRQIREMFAKIDLDVLKLQRVAIGRLKIGSLPRGEWAELSSEQIKRVFIPDLPEDKIKAEKAKSATAPTASAPARLKKRIPRKTDRQVGKLDFNQL
jgi:23S rRNA pseudouridine2605 synthase